MDSLNKLKEEMYSAFQQREELLTKRLEVKEDQILDLKRSLRGMERLEDIIEEQKSEIGMYKSSI